MMGGPYPIPTDSDPAILSIVLRHLERHLSKRLPEPVFYRISHHLNCIPTLGVGHLGRMKQLEAALMLKGGPWEGRLAVIGAGVGGVSVGDCVQAGRAVGKHW
jgi:protoporphyrinogen/coproporphyrinogen III oxidase